MNYKLNTKLFVLMQEGCYNYKRTKLLVVTQRNVRYGRFENVFIYERFYAP